MKKLLSSTTALSIALFNVQPWPLMAQTLLEDGSVVAIDGTVLCVPTAETVCDPANFVDAAAAIEAALPPAEVVPEVAVEPVPEVAVEPVPEVAVEPVPEVAVEPVPEVAVEPVPEVAVEPVPEVAVEPVPEVAVEPVPEVAVEPVPEVAVEPVPEVTPEVAAEVAAQDAAAVDAAIQELSVAGEVVDPTLGLAVAAPIPAEEIVPVDVPVVDVATSASLVEVLAQPGTVDPAAIGAAATLLAAPVVEGTMPDAVPVSEAAVTSLTETITAQTERASTMEFAAAPVALADGKKSGLSNLEKVGLFALGALVVGEIIKEGNRKEQQRVVSNTGDRIVVLKPDGTYQVYKDDDAVLRQPGAKVRTETFKDGSTRTIVGREDGTQIVTIRDASGRVLRRAHYDKLGRELVLIDDLYEEKPVVVSTLPKPRKDRVVISTKDEDAALRAKLAAKEAARVGRKFSLRQIREIAEVRALAATVDVDTITFDSGSSAIKASEADDLMELGSLMQDLLDANPGEMFLIEGHTDATGKAALNLALSDRRAESVALALTEYFDIPPENMVIQGYGETELRIDTQANESRNRRVAVRLITPLMRTAAN